MARTHSQGQSLTFDELCEEAFGSGLQPWEFYEYDLIEYGQRRKGIARQNKHRYQELLIASMAPYMTKSDRAQVVKDAFREVGEKRETPKEMFNRIQQRYIDAGALDNDVKRNRNKDRR